jgi:hypothetical protein
LRYGKLPEETVIRIVKCVVHGCSIQATADICDVDPRTGCGSPPCPGHPRSGTTRPWAWAAATGEEAGLLARPGLIADHSQAISGVVT